MSLIKDYIVWYTKYHRHNKRVLKGLKYGSRYCPVFGYVDEMPVLGRTTFRVFRSKDQKEARNEQRKIDLKELLGNSPNWGRNSYCNKEGVFDRLVELNNMKTLTQFDL